jgi:hypothetical protein
MWFPEPPKANAAPAPGKEKAVKAGATMVSAAGGKSLPILLPKDQISGNESFLEKELKFARRWLYNKGVMSPEEDKNPVDNELESFLQNVRDGKRPRADVEGRPARFDLRHALQYVHGAGAPHQLLRDRQDGPARETRKESLATINADARRLVFLICVYLRPSAA